MSTDVAGHFCSHIGTVSQAAPAAMLQVHQRHMRTRLYLAVAYTSAAGQGIAGNKTDIMSVRILIIVIQSVTFPLATTQNAKF